MDPNTTEIWTSELFGKLSKLNLTGIIMQSVKSMGRFRHAKTNEINNRLIDERTDHKCRISLILQVVHRKL